MIDRAPDRHEAARHAMVELQLRRRGIRDQRVLAAMARVPRHEFVSARQQEFAYEDRPLPTEEGQTVSQPYIVAFMLERLALAASDRVLEVGTGSGYQTALLAELTRHVYSIERHASLAQQAEAILSFLGYTNLTIVVGDGTLGVPQWAPYDRIVVSAAAPEIPASLVDQLGESGRMIVPVGPLLSQQLQLVEKREGRAVVTLLENCRFVPLIGVEGYAPGG
jgi:protein-L-isoaspartate(D-aspartate) O-methyltransferase